jgi:AAA domain-containing protein
MFNLNEEFALVGERKKAADTMQEAPAAKQQTISTAKDRAAVNLNPRQLSGGSVIDYARLKIDHSKTLLGDRYLCRGSGMFIVAPSGQGKSTMAVQMAAEYALGWASIDIRPSGPLRTLIVQAEDDAGDVHEMSAWIDNHQLSDGQKSLIAGNTHIELVNDVSGFKFIDTLDEILQQWAADIVIINPYTSYIGGDARDEELANGWLRNRLTPLLVKRNCGSIIFHHTPKTQFARSADFTASEFMYRGAGCASMTNWARAYMVFEPVPPEEKHFRFVAAKRGKRIGWGGLVRYFKHSDNGELRWIASTPDEVEQLEADRNAKGNRRVNIDPKKILSFVPLMDPERFDVIANRISKGLGLSPRRAQTELNILEGEKKVFFTWPSDQNPKKKGGRPAKFVSQLQPTAEDTQSELVNK